MKLWLISPKVVIYYLIVMVLRDVVLIATGSEVGITMDASKELTGKGKNVRVVSMPCTNVF